MTPWHINNFVDFLYLPHYCMLIVYSSSLKKDKRKYLNRATRQTGDLYFAHPSSVHSIFQASKLSSVSTVFCWNCVHGFSVIILIDGFGVIILIEHTFQQITREIKRFVINNTLKYLCVIFSGHSSMDECFPLEVITAKYVFFNILI